MRSIFRPSEDKVLAEIKDVFELLSNQEQINRELRNEIEELKNEDLKEARKDEAFAKMEQVRDQLSEKLYNSFTLTKEQVQEAREWTSKHNEEVHKNRSAGAIGGRYTYKFTPTGLGTFASVVCSCGAECDLSKDYDF